MSKKHKIILGISCGDINGIGLETFLKAFLDKRLFDFCIPVLYAPQEVVDYYKKFYDLQDLKYCIITNSNQASSGQVNLIQLFNESLSIKMGKVTKTAAKIAVQSLDVAMRDLKDNSINALVTLPVNKQGISLIKKDFIGHTEYFSKNCNNTESLMLLCSNDLKIATVTNHVPIAKVSKLITPSLLKNKIQILIKTLKMDFLISNPKIAVLSLNPHGGDNGLIGSEDDDIIRPVIKFFFNKGELIYGPYAKVIIKKHKNLLIKR